MARLRNREEVINTQLALVVSKLGVKADAETIHLHGIHRPDVLFELRGLRVVIEGKFDDNSAAAELVSKDARHRVQSGIAHLAVAVVYPIELRTTTTTEIFDALTTSELKFRIISEHQEGKDWHEGSPSTLMDALRRAQEALTEDNIVEQTAISLSTKLEGIAQLWAGHPGALVRLSVILGLGAPVGETKKEAADRGETIAKVAALVLANAYIFQEQLAKTDERVETLRSTSKQPDVIGYTSDHWRWIWENINYVPIFQLGERVLNELPADSGSTSTVKLLLSEAQAICTKQTALRHDLMGRIYHWLLHHAKFLGTYYTSVSAATMLIKLAMDSDWPQDFGSAKDLSNFKIADLACGTGTLLMASAQAITDKYIRARAADGRTITDKDLSVLHSTIMQNMLYGYDVLPSAVHLTASTLALLAPEVAFRQMNLFVMPMGLDHQIPRLGSLDFIDGGEVKTQFSLDDTQLDTIRTGASKSRYVNAKVPKLDLCVMNPPFVSSRYGNLLFGSLPGERAALQKELRRRAREMSVSATAGLGALFVPLADKHVKPGGRIAFVLPIALATGESWSSVRKFIADRYQLEVVVTSHDAQRVNFSENTDLSELLFIARKRSKSESTGTTSYVNLWRNPRSVHESLDQTTRISSAISKRRGKKDWSQIVRSTTGIIGEITNLPSPGGYDNWTGAIFAQSSLMKIYWALDRDFELRIPNEKVTKIALCALGDLGSLGYDARDIADAFEVDRAAENWTPYAGFWDHDARVVLTLAQKPNAYLAARSEPIKGRKLKSAKAVWAKAGRILLVSRLRMNTHKVIATGFQKKAIGNTWWSFDDSDLDDVQSKALLLWLNSSLGILQYFGRRAITQGAWMQMKKPAWSSMPVLNVKALSSVQLTLLSGAYDKISSQALGPIAGLERDDVRQKIDAAVEKVLRLPDLSDLRHLLAREPGLSAKAINPQAIDMSEEDDEDQMVFAV